ncbi:Nucleus export protein Brr6 [Drechmeria coniospora]|uniref:Nucleus export protein Brr6 n=1 Tax=Drechmeria coniospora TaxID=98403 RepID=A0A151GPA5_DRECN|nr:Nucleus export protein Brr6 [Drechmeria coniospora]KYK58832.1 Nucleus export protein Brr6 [Drechmeria coniospora]ODA84201.1 hypothetical protein RJ55_02719 [Drechmeria coniospora]
MDSRTCEGPMDWEYQDRGPFDPTSPFAQAAQNVARGNLFASPLKSPTRRNQNPFTNPSTPSKYRPFPPQTSSFTPQVSSRNMAPPFRNPAFTTPRRPIDEVVLSEASGAEDSPALTEVSDYPNDTPEVDHKSDVAMGGAMLPLKIDKASRYGKSGLPSKKHAAGRGEIRPCRELSISMRKRKRHNYDRDVGSVGRHHGTDSDADSDTNAVSHASKAKRPNDRLRQKGTFEAFFHMLNQYPNAPDHMQRWMQFGANLFLVCVLAYLGWSIVSTVRYDIFRANELARQELERKMTECQTQYRINECAKGDRPALTAMCGEWHECMMQTPESIMRIKVTAKQVAEIINEFSEAMNLKAWGIVVCFIFVCTTLNVGTLSRPSGIKSSPSPPLSSSGFRDSAKSPGIAPGYMLVPVQTPKVQRSEMLDEGTDTENSPLNLMPALPHGTPSGRRSPSKGSRQPSPVKYGRAPPSNIYR